MGFSFNPDRKKRHFPSENKEAAKSRQPRTRLEYLRYERQQVVDQLKKNLRGFGGLRRAGANSRLIGRRTELDRQIEEEEEKQQRRLEGGQ